MRPPHASAGAVGVARAMRAGRGRAAALAIAGGAAAGFVLLATPRLEAQGLYYDELHQAPASFLRLGKPAYLFAPVRWRQFPLLTMPYSGAVKSVLYGEWMRVTGHGFTIWTWRMFGILLAASGLLAFLALSGRMLGATGSVLFSALFLGDTTLLLTSRHDWGPTAMALCLRLLWLGVWLRAEERQEYDGASLFLLGATPTFLVYEKLSNAAFLVPLALAVAFTPRLRTRRSWLWLAGGLLAGLAPLAAVNALDHWISWRAAGAEHGGRLPLLEYAGALLSVGSGAQVRSWLLGVETPDAIRCGEVLLVGAGLSASVIGGAAGLRSARARAGLLCAASYAGAGIATWLMPQTWLHHWVGATPLQYAALALAVGGAEPEASGGSDARRAPAKGVAPAVVLLVAIAAVRLGPLWDTERALLQGAASPTWSLSYTRVAQYVVDHREEAAFVLADWGFATAIHALSNGSLALEEPFAEYGGPDHLRRLVAGRPFHVISRARAPAVNPRNTEAIRRDAFLVAGGRTLPVEPELAFPEFEILKFAAP
jgi:hypothetical protein